MNVRLIEDFQSIIFVLVIIIMIFLIALVREEHYIMLKKLAEICIQFIGIY